LNGCRDDKYPSQITEILNTARKERDSLTEEWPFNFEKNLPMALINFNNGNNIHIFYTNQEKPSRILDRRT
jgi:hypothetical protein